MWQRRMTPEEATAPVRSMIFSTTRPPRKELELLLWLWKRREAGTTQTENPSIGAVCALDRHNQKG